MSVACDLCPRVLPHGPCLLEVCKCKDDVCCPSTETRPVSSFLINDFFSLGCHECSPKRQWLRIGVAGAISLIRTSFYSTEHHQNVDTDADNSWRLHLIQNINASPLSSWSASSHGLYNLQASSQEVRRAEAVVSSQGEIQISA